MEIAYKKDGNENYMIIREHKINENDYKLQMILNNNAKIVKGASKSVVRQKAKGLTLSKNAKIKAMPNLYIDEYDVIANHAASIGSISKEDLFYLMSRGLEERDAAKLIVLGFVQPLLDKIADESLRKEIQENFVSKL